MRKVSVYLLYEDFMCLAMQFLTCTGHSHKLLLILLLLVIPGGTMSPISLSGLKSANMSTLRHLDVVQIDFSG